MRLSSTNVVFAFMFGAVCGANAAYAQVAESNVHKRTVGGRVLQSERDENEAIFNYYFRDRDLKFETKLSELKTEASVPSWRIPYSAAIHSESHGGMSDLSRGGRASGGRRGQMVGGSGASPLSVYDRAFNGGRDSANAYERKRLLGTERALFTGVRLRRNNEPWEGYCSGFTASVIRHPEPVYPVDAGKVGGTPGVVLQPAEIKALLTSIYNRTTNDSYLYVAQPSARDGGPNMGTFHLALCNYIGQAGHPIGIDRTKGEVSWNNPIYAYKVNSITDAGSRDKLTYKNVDTTITYTWYASDFDRQTDTETGDRRGQAAQSMRFRYTLAVDEEDRIVGGTATNYNGHFLWIPLYAVQGNQTSTNVGNPYIDVRKVIALARASAVPDVQKKYDQANIGPGLDPAVTKKPKPTDEAAETETTTAAAAPASP